ncbi:MAG: peptide chain release factor 2 [bacterium]|nr:peptide chain release factor 2 [bacterium]
MPSGTLFDLANKAVEWSSLKNEMAAPNFWNNAEHAQKITGRVKQLKAVVEPVEQVCARLADAHTMVEMLAEEDDEATRQELATEAQALVVEIDRVELLTLLARPNDALDCYFNIQGGTGGADAQDWAEMLMRMYLRYFERCGYEVELLSKKEGEEAGIQSVSLLVKGNYAYGYLSCETGVHRLVRISPFNAQRKRQTSFSSVDVQPVLEDVEIEVDWETDVREDTYRASGAGGQHVNKTSSAVRLTHESTGLVAQCQNERSQHKNRARARKMLLSRLYLMEEAKRDAELAKIYGDKGQIGWGNAIRSYFLYPERRVKDGRTGVVTADTDGVLDGDLQTFIDAELRRRAAERNAGKQTRSSG